MSDDDDMKRLFHGAYETFEEHSKRIGSLLSNAQEKFEHDYTSYSATIGTALMALAGFLAWSGKAEAFCIVLACIGALILVVALVLRHMSADAQARHTQTLLELERERARFSQRSAIMQHMWLYGPPKNVTPDQLRFLLGDTSSSSTPTFPAAVSHLPSDSAQQDGSPNV